MKEKLLTILYKTRSAFDHYIFFMAEFLLAAIVLITGTEVTGAIIFLLLICIKLFICDDILSIINPILMASVFLTNCYDSYDTFIQYVYLVIPAAAALIFHLVVYRKKIVVGKSLYGILAVAFAILVGGLGKVPLEKYLIGSNLYYYLGLSIGMVLIYLFMKSRLATERKYDLNEKFAVIMTLWGLLTVFNIAFYYYGYLRDPSDINITQYLSANYLSRNNLSTYIMFALPFPLLLSKKISRGSLAFGCFLHCNDSDRLKRRIHHGKHRVFILYSVLDSRRKTTYFKGVDNRGDRGDCGIRA